MSEMLPPNEALEVYLAIQKIRDFTRKAALIAPTISIFAPQVGAPLQLALELEPVAENVLSLLFEAASAMEKHTTLEEQQAAVEQAVRAEVDRKLHARFE